MKNCAANMLNEIPQGENYLWDFSSLLRSLLKYQSTSTSSGILWSALQRITSPCSKPPTPTVLPEVPFHSLQSLLGERPGLEILSNMEVTPQYWSLVPIIPRQSRLTYMTAYSLWPSTPDLHDPRRIPDFASKIYTSPQNFCLSKWSTIQQPTQT